VNDTLLEDALRAHLNRRCRRAYAHDLRNGMQGIFGGVDALTRAARSTKPLVVPLEQLTQFVQQAIVNHERGLERVLESIAPEQQAPAIVSVRELLTDQVRFMTNDTARHNVRVRQDYSDDLKVSAVHARLRLIALGLLTDSIDAMSTGGEMRVAGRTIDGRVQFEIIDTRTQPRSTTFVHEAIERLVTDLSGRIDYQPSATGGSEVRVELPAA
jgi:nitrogen-specific signal transduction histidine kinase